MCSYLILHLSFFPRLFHLQPHNLPTWTKFSVFFIENTVPKNHKYNNHSERFALNQLKVDLYALMDKRNLHSPTLVLLYMYVLSKISHTFQPNQAPNGFWCRLHHFPNVPALLQSFVLVYRYTKCQNIHMKFFRRIHFTSLALEKKINLQTSEVNSTSLRKHIHDWIYQTTMGGYADVFSVP